MNLQQSEPVTLIASIKMAAIGVATAVAIGLELEATMAAAVVGAASAVAVLLGMLLERAAVFSPKTYQHDVEVALKQDPPA